MAATQNISNYDQLVKDHEEALALKNKGNAAFKEKDYALALKSYSQILLHIGMNPSTDVSSMFGQNTHKESSEEVNKIQHTINELRLSAFNNMAMVHLKQNNYSKVV
eukprot:327613_1